MYPDQKTAGALTWEIYFYDSKVQSNNLDDYTCKPSKRGVIVTSAKDVPPLERKVGEYSGNESLMPL